MLAGRHAVPSRGRGITLGRRSTAFDDCMVARLCAYLKDAKESHVEFCACALWLAGRGGFSGLFCVAGALLYLTVYMRAHAFALFACARTRGLVEMYSCVHALLIGIGCAT